MGRVYHIFLDESRQSKDRFMVLSGLIMTQAHQLTFDKTMADFRKKFNMTSELKWSKISRGKLHEYKGFVDYFFSLVDNNYAHFHSIIIDNSQVNNKKFNRGDYDLGFYKFFYQLLIHKFGKRYASNERGERFICYFDQRQSKYSLSNLKDVLNNGLRSRHGLATSPFRSIESEDSKKSDALQINDIILGAIGWHKNGYDRISGASPAKIELADYIAEKAGLGRLGYNTPYAAKMFSQWNFRLQK